MKKFQISSDCRFLTKKPKTDEEVKRFNSNFKRSLTSLDIPSIKYLSNMMANDGGYATTLATYKFNSRKNEFWISQQAAAADYDLNIDPDAFYSKCVELDFTPSIIYTSFSDTPEYRKFRAVWVFDQVITDKNQMKELQLKLMSFSDSLGFKVDDACKDYARLWYPGKEVLYLNETPVSLDKFSDVLKDVGREEVGNVDGDDARVESAQMNL